MVQCKLLNEYLEICSRFSADGLSKQERKQRYILLSTWEKNMYNEPLPTLEEFRKCHGSYCHNPIIYTKKPLVRYRSMTKAAQEVG